MAETLQSVKLVYGVSYKTGLNPEDRYFKQRLSLSGLLATLCLFIKSVFRAESWFEWDSIQEPYTFTRRTIYFVEFLSSTLRTTFVNNTQASFNRHKRLRFSTATSDWWKRFQPKNPPTSSNLFQRSHAKLSSLPLIDSQRTQNKPKTFLRKLISSSKTKTPYRLQDIQNVATLLCSLAKVEKVFAALSTSENKEKNVLSAWRVIQFSSHLFNFF
jgi:hypothetical protein